MFWLVLIFLLLGLAAISLQYVPAGYMGVMKRALPVIFKKAAPGHIIARGREQGYEAEVLMPGFHLLLGSRIWGKLYLKKQLRLGNEQVLFVTALDGAPKSTRGFYCARADPRGFRDAAYFLRNGGEVGPHAWRIGPGGIITYNWFLFDVVPADRVKFDPVEIDDPDNAGQKLKLATFGVFTSYIGESIPEDDKHRVIGRAVDCDDYQDVEAFLRGDRSGGGQKGPQERIVTGSGFFDPRAFKVEKHHQTHIPVGSVGVRRSNLGDVPEPGSGSYIPRDDKRFFFEVPAGRGKTKRIPRVYTEVLTAKASHTMRGIREDFYGAGDYPINPFVEQVIPLDTTERRICFSNGPGAFGPPISGADTKEGYEVGLHVDTVYSVDPACPPMVVRLSGSLEQLERDYIGHSISTAVREVVSGLSIDELREERGRVRERIEKKVRVILSEHFLLLNRFNIVDIDFSAERTKDYIEAATEGKQLEIDRGNEAQRQEVERLRGLADAQHGIQASIGRAQEIRNIGAAEADAVRSRARAQQAVLEATSAATSAVQIAAMLVTNAPAIGEGIGNAIHGGRDSAAKDEKKEK